MMERLLYCERQRQDVYLRISQLPPKLQEDQLKADNNAMECGGKLETFFPITDQISFLNRPYKKGLWWKNSFVFIRHLDRPTRVHNKINSMKIFVCTDKHIKYIWTYLFVVKMTKFEQYKNGTKPPAINRKRGCVTGIKFLIFSRTTGRLKTIIE